MRKFIVSHNSSDRKYRSGNVFVVASYNTSLETYQRLFAEVQKDFPEQNLKPKDIECGTIIGSSWANRCAAIRFSIVPDTKREGYENREDKLPDATFYP